MSDETMSITPQDADNLLSAIISADHDGSIGEAIHARAQEQDMQGILGWLATDPDDPDASAAAFAALRDLITMGQRFPIA